MKEILSNVPCYRERGEYTVFGDPEHTSLPYPRLPVLHDAWIAHSLVPEVKIPVKVLLDTGNDITIVEPQVLFRLEAEVQKRVDAGEVKASIPIPFNTERAIPHASNDLEDPGQPPPAPGFFPVFTLTLFLTPEDNYSSVHGVIARSGWDFEGMDVWLGQDILSQLKVTFDGVGGEVSILDPAKT